MKIKDIMTDNPVTITPDTTLCQTAKLMQEHDIGIVPVNDSQGQLVGMVTDRDIIVRNIAQDGDPKTTTAGQIMTTDIASVNQDTDASYVTQIMSNEKIRRIPVVEGNKVIGIVSLGDMATTTSLSFETADALSAISS